MSLWKIAWRSIQQRRISSALTAVSMALGVALVVAVLVIYGVIQKSFGRSAQGYDVIVGPKGSRLELVLNAVYHLGKEVGKIPYQHYEDLRTSRFAPYVSKAVPICMGDNYGDARVIGTTPAMFDDFEYMEGKRYAFSAGQNFDDADVRGAVVGAAVAKKAGLGVGSTFRPRHGQADTGQEHDPFHVTGVLEHTGTPCDRAVFVNIEGFWEQHEEAGHHEHHEGCEHPREVNAILVATNGDTPDALFKLSRALEQDPKTRHALQAVPASEVIQGLLRGIIGDLQMILVLFAAFIVIVAGIGMMVAIYNSMSDRRHEIAVMRALGARRTTVMSVVLLESILLALGGGAIGVLLGHGLTAALAPMILSRTDVLVNPLAFQTIELVLIPGLIALASVVGYMPAVVAYRTDVAQSLISTP